MPYPQEQGGVNMKYMKPAFSNMVPYHSKMIEDGIILNSNESPFEPPLDVKEEIKREILNVEWNRYPDMDTNLLNEAIAKHYKIQKENVTCGVGSDELLDCMFRAVLNEGDTVLGFSPSFSMYQVFSELALAKYVPILGDSNMQFSVSLMIEKIKEYNPKIVLICSPNNPTGQYFTKEEVKKVIESTNALVALDLAYIDFSYEDYATIALDYDNVICFKTFSKALALPSIRLGYAISTKDNIDMLNAIKAPYSVTSLTQKIGAIAISRFSSYQGQINLIKREREYLYNELKERGYNVYPSEANFIFLTMDDSLYEELLRNKIYIRKFKSGSYRITVGSHYENSRLLEVLK